MSSKAAALPLPLPPSLLLTPFLRSLVLGNVLKGGLVPIGAHGTLPQHELAVGVAAGQMPALLVGTGALTHLRTGGTRVMYRIWCARYRLELQRKRCSLLLPPPQARKGVGNRQPSPTLPSTLVPYPPFPPCP